MNKLLPYEQLIAEKIQQPTLPALADSIWATVEQELNNGLAAEEGKEPPSSKNGSPAFSRIWIYFVAVIVIVIASIILFRNKTSKNTSPAPVLPDTTNPGKETKVLPADNLPAQDADYRENKKSIRDTVTQDDTYVPVTPGLDSIQDQARPNPVDTTNDVIIKKEPAPGLLIDSAGKQSTPAKSKGIKGIKDDDYIIKTSKKDSAKQ